MNFLTYTAPEDRVIPATYDMSGWYRLEGRDPVWRELLMNLGYRLDAFAWLFRYRDDKRPIGPLDHIRWFIEGIAHRFTCAGLDGSLAEARMIINSEIPWRYVDPATKRRLLAEYPDLFVPVDPQWLADELADDAERRREIEEMMS